MLSWIYEAFILINMPNKSLLQTADSFLKVLFWLRIGNSQPVPSLQPHALSTRVQGTHWIQHLWELYSY